MFLRIRHTTMATDWNSPSAMGRPVEMNSSPHTMCSPRHQIGELLTVQSCHSLVPQQLFADPCLMRENAEQDGKSCCTSSVTHPLCPYRDQVAGRVSILHCQFIELPLVNKPPELIG